MESAGRDRRPSTATRPGPWTAKASGRRPPRSRNRFSIPGLRGRIKVVVNSTTVGRPRSVHFPEGLRYRNREVITPPENDLGGLRRWPRLCR